MERNYIFIEQSGKFSINSWEKNIQAEETVSIKIFAGKIGISLCV